MQTHTGDDCVRTQGEGPTSPGHGARPRRTRPADFLNLGVLASRTGRQCFCCLSPQHVVLCYEQSVLTDPPKPRVGQKSAASSQALASLVTVQSLWPTCGPV